MEKPTANAFQDLPCSARQHFVLHLFAAIYRVLNHLRRLGEAGGEELDVVFKRYPFLTGYFGEMLTIMPAGITWEEAPAWWEREIVGWEQQNDVDLPLRTLTEEGGVEFNGRLALVLAGLVEEDSRFGTLFATLQAPLGYRRPCLELIGQLLMDGTTADPWATGRPLLSPGLVVATNPDAPRSEWVLHVPALLWDVIRGEAVTAGAGNGGYHPPETFLPLAALILPEVFQAQLGKLPALVQSGKAQTIILRGSLGSERLPVMGAIARALGRGMVLVERAPPPGLGPFCTMTRAMPVFVYDLGPGETAAGPQLAGYHGPAGILLGEAGGLQGQALASAVTLTLPQSRAGERRRQWQAALNGHPAADLAAISERFHLPGGYIRQAATMAIAHAALEDGDTVRLDHVQAACRALNRQLLDDLAAPLESGGGWEQLVVSPISATKLYELERRCRHRERLLEHLGPAFGRAHNCGVRALFTGASGTGKTLAARILAAELGMDLYRVDLAAVVNKYIGETEKNLHRVLSRAEELDVILLLDEGDALLGGRTEVRSANDRYANLETDYLLQRLEHYQGIVVVTTNAAENIDSAFQRRMDVVVNFVAPQAEERWRIWQLHLPEDHLVDHACLEEVAVRCAITGGQIRNAALHATLLALDEGRPLASWHLEEAIRSEYRKAGATCPLPGGRFEQPATGLEAFLDAFVTDSRQVM
ncbi:MAG: ATP-binding protein [Chloroflexi bacterium]|nr:ATP-binding protein [Chloroflexota bacterium]MCI0577003.1 ATP-binding protein [Chloroflexota bacterium]MCI0647776.1 ATP-binding protein [Chloroflexota bacterium]MCI0729022.1 ATP-binding protein [Chloroflexota bacterium]